MNVRRCDICEKKFKKDDPVIRAGLGILEEKDFCLECGKPVVDFLKKHKFTREEK